MTTDDILQRTQGLLADLVGFDTTSSRSNLELIDYVVTYLRDLGVAAQLYPDANGDKANLFATIGPPVDGGVVLSGHTDVVPVQGQRWSSDPFTLKERGDRLYGRGACDMKGFIAAALALVPTFLRERLTVPLHLALSFDEETGCRGVPLMLAHIGRDLPRPRIAIIGEPTEMRIVAGHKAGCEYTTTVRGRAGHASAPHKAVNAVSYAAKLVSYLDRAAAERAAEAAAESPFDPPFTTVSVGVLQGGSAVNIVPDECSFRWEVRPLPGEDLHAVAHGVAEYARTELLPRMHAVAPEASITTTHDVDYPGFRFDPDSAAVRLLRQLTDASETRVVSFGTEAGLFEAAGISAAVCGPGSIEQAHKPDEFIRREQLAACVAFMDRLRGWAASATPRL